MVEQVKGVHAELQPKALGKVEVLHDRRVRRKGTRSGQGEHAGVAERASTRPAPRTDDHAILRHCLNRGEKRDSMSDRVERSSAHRPKRTVALQRYTETYILVRVAVVIAGREWQSCRIIGGR